MVERGGRQAILFKVDVTREKEVEQAVSEVVKALASIDILFNNAGICISEAAEHMSYEEWRKVVDVNLNGAFLVARAVGRSMIARRRGGSIINNASMSGDVVNFPQGLCAYNSKKAALIRLTKSLAVEWAKYGIRVNALSPGYIETAMTLMAPKEWRDQWISMAPLGRIGKLKEIQGAAVYLASNASRFTTGSVLVVDGGYSCI